MRKNKIEGPIKGSGRKPKINKSQILNVRISKEAKEFINMIDRMERGIIVSKAIEYFFEQKNRTC